MCPGFTAAAITNLAKEGLHMIFRELEAGAKAGEVVNRVRTLPVNTSDPRPPIPCLRIYAGCTRTCVLAANGSHSMDAALRDLRHFLRPMTMLSELPFPHLMVTATLPPRSL